jgi:hypothetical protein
MSPMCWLSHAYRPSATAHVFLRSAPAASIGPTSKGSATGSGAYPRERRTGSSAPPTCRLTESSAGTRIGRSCRSHASASGPSRLSASASSVTIGSPATLPEVSTSASGPSGSPGRPNSSTCSGV